MNKVGSSIEKKLYRGLILVSIKKSFVLGFRLGVA